MIRVSLADLVEHHSPGSTWEQKAQEDNNLTKPAFFNIARKAQNFLKHARDDPTGILEFNPSDTDALLILAVFNASELGPLPGEADILQLWGLALLCPNDMKSVSPFREAIEYFGDLHNMPRSAQLAAGRRGLVDLGGA